jgi:hypothetical protein
VRKSFGAVFTESAAVKVSYICSGISTPSRQNRAVLILVPEKPDVAVQREEVAEKSVSARTKVRWRSRGLYNSIEERLAAAWALSFH